MWHLFSFGLCPHLHGGKAREAYRAQQTQPYYLFSEGVAECMLVAAEPFPHLVLGQGDWYVVPTSFEWSYVSTHESLEFFARAA
jgi:hypothetical protein